MGKKRSRKGKAPGLVEVADPDAKYYVNRADEDHLFGLDEHSDNDDVLAGEDRVGNADDADDQVLGLDVPTDSDVSDADDDFEEDSSDDDGGDDDESADDDEKDGVQVSGWGKRRSAFYDADDTFADDEAAKMEEEEAARLKQARLEQLREEDFLDGAFALGVDSSGASAASTAAEQQTAEHLEVVEKRARSAMTRDEVLEQLATASPDLLEFVLQFQAQVSDLRDAVAPLHALAQRLEPADSPVRAYLRCKYQTVAAYVLNVGFYLALYAKGIPRREIQAHPVVRVLVNLQRSLDAIKKLEKDKPWLVQRLEPLISAMEDMEELDMDVDAYLEYVNKELEREMREEAEDEEDGDEESDEIFDDDDEDDMSDVVEEKPVKSAKRKREETSSNSAISEASSPPSKTAKRQKKAKTLSIEYEDDYKRRKAESTHADKLDDYDDNLADAALGVTPSAAAAFMPSKRSLRKVVQGIQAHGKAKPTVSADGDVGKKSKKGADRLNVHLTKEQMAAADMEADVFSDDDGFGPENAAQPQGPRKKVRPGELDMSLVDPERPIQSLAEVRRAKLAARAAKEFKKAVTFADESADDSDTNDLSAAVGAEKRVASYDILKNKGLTPRRKKEDRNPRLKNRRKYEKKEKKLKTFKRVATELKGGYQGELTGIKTHLTRSVKLQ